MSWDLAAYGRKEAPEATSRIVPSRYPPVASFEYVTSVDDLEAVFELEGWTNDRLVAARLSRIDRAQWVYGRPNASIVMSAFLHGSAQGMRFSGPDLGAWYAGADLMTCVLEVANSLRKEIALSSLSYMHQTYREYQARLVGDFVDIFGIHPEFHDPDDSTYPVPQRFGEYVRMNGSVSSAVGIRYESVRRPGHANWVCLHPPAVQDVVQSRHFRVNVRPTGKVTVETTP